MMSKRPYNPGNVWGLEEVEGDNPFLPTNQITGRFVKALPLSWLKRVGVAAYTVRIALLIKSQVDTKGGEPITIPTWMWQELGLARNTRKRALDALERAGVIRTERPPGRTTKI